MLKEGIDSNVLVDSTLMDVNVMDNNIFLLGRPWLTIILHNKTKLPLGFHLSFEPPSERTTLEALKHSILPKTYVRDFYPEVEEGWGTYLLPSKIILDNGAMFTKHFFDVCSELGIIVEFNPSFIGIGEKKIRILSAQIKKHLEMNGSVEYKKINEIIHKWIIDEHAQMLLNWILVGKNGFLLNIRSRFHLSN
jgi:putative transposase